MKLGQVIKIGRAGWSVCGAWNAIQHEGVVIDDVRLVKQAQALSAPLLALVAALGFTIPSGWIEGVSIVVVVLGFLWHGAAALASSPTVGLRGLLKSLRVQSPPALPTGPGSTLSGDRRAVPGGPVAVSAEPGPGAQMQTVTPSSAEDRDTHPPPDAVVWPDQAGYPWSDK